MFLYHSWTYSVSDWFGVFKPCSYIVPKVSQIGDTYSLAFGLLAPDPSVWAFILTRYEEEYTVYLSRPFLLQQNHFFHTRHEMQTCFNSARIDSYFFFHNQNSILKFLSQFVNTKDCFLSPVCLFFVSTAEKSENCGYGWILPSVCLCFAAL